MRNPQFEKEFNKTFDNRFRLRWSNKQQEYLVEQRIGKSNPNIIPPIDEDGIYDTYDDTYIRARDGYFFVMSVKAGTKMRCPVCSIELDVPIMLTAEAICEYCRAMGRDGRYKAAYYPLNHTLIEHIKDIDPDNDGPMRARQRIRSRQIEQKARERKDALDEADYNVRFNTNQANHHPMVGYGPKTAQRGDQTRFE